MISSLLRRFKPMTLVRFAAGGVISSGVTLGTTAFLHEITGLRETVAAGFGLAAALVVNFLLLRLYVFRGTQRSFSAQLAMFLGSSGVFRAIEYAAFLLVHATLDLHYLVGLILVLGSSFLLKFVVYEGWVFARREDAKDSPARGAGVDVP